MIESPSTRDAGVGVGIGVGRRRRREVLQLLEWWGWVLDAVAEVGVVVGYELELEREVPGNGEAE